MTRSQKLMRVFVIHKKLRFPVFSALSASK